MATTYATLTMASSGPANLGTLAAKTDRYDFCNSLEDITNGLNGGAFGGYITAQQINNDAVAATGSFSVSSGVAGDTAVVAGTTLTCVDHRETTNVTFTNDTAGSLNNDYFTFQDQPGTHKYYIWFNINSAGTDPALAGRTGLMVAGATGALAATLATAAVAAASATVGVTVSAGASGHIIVTDNAPGVATPVTEGADPTGFTFTRTITGSALTSAQYQVYATDALTTADLARALNANATTSLYVTASAASTTATLTATQAGVFGNQITTTATGGVSAGGAKLTGGSNDTTSATATTFHYGL